MKKMGRVFVLAILIAITFCSYPIIGSFGINDDYFLLIFRNIIPSIILGMCIFMFSDLVSKKLGLLSISKVTAGKM